MRHRLVLSLLMIIVCGSAFAATQGGPNPRSVAALSAEQLVEHRRQQRTARPQLRELHHVHRDAQGLHPDFGGDSDDPEFPVYGIPYIIVDGDQPKKTVTFEFDRRERRRDPPGSSRSIRSPTRPSRMTGWIEGGLAGQRRRATTATGTCSSSTRRTTISTSCTTSVYNGTSWEAGSGAFFDMNTNNRRPEGWTSADAAGLAILPGLVRYDEVVRPGRDPPRVPRHRARDQRPRLSGVAHGRLDGRRAADGRAPAAEGEQGHLGLPAGRCRRSSAR